MREESAYHAVADLVQTKEKKKAETEKLRGKEDGGKE